MLEQFKGIINYNKCCVVVHIMPYMTIVSAIATSLHHGCFKFVLDGKSSQAVIAAY
jgi:hypothetical protein